jgi:hypothetical protein
VHSIISRQVRSMCPPADPAVLVMMIIPSYMMVMEGMIHEVPVLSSSHL